MKRCAIMVSAGTYRAAGQCAKVHGLKRVQLIDQKILVCAHHNAVLNSGGITSLLTTKRGKR